MLNDDIIITNMIDWVNYVNSIILQRPIPVITSNQDAPAPSGLYMIVSYAPGRTPIGQVTKGQDTDVYGDLDLYYDKYVNIQFWVEGGGTERLSSLVDSLERNDVQTMFFGLSSKGMSSSEVITPPQNDPRLQSTRWRKEAMMELQFLITESETENTSFIEDMQYTGTIPAQGRSGNHIITNV